jgi:hypothetical protein
MPDGNGEVVALDLLLFSLLFFGYWDMFIVERSISVDIFSHSS